MTYLGYIFDPTPWENAAYATQFAILSNLSERGGACGPPPNSNGGAANNPPFGPRK
jgi:hypothetical protein